MKVGLPAKSGVSGALIVVVPNVMGIGLWSPALDEIGNSVRGLQFCQVNNLRRHLYNRTLSILGGSVTVVGLVFSLAGLDLTKQENVLLYACTVTTEFRPV